MKFVETKQPRVARDFSRDNAHRIGLALMPVQRVVDLLHEAVKMDAALACDRRTIENILKARFGKDADRSGSLRSAYRTICKSFL